MSVGSVRTSTLAELRRSFDRSFAEAPRDETAPHVDVLAISVGDDPYAVRLADISGIFANKKVTWLPGPVVELLGLASVRGTLLPVYDLRAVLGYPKTSTCRWLVVTARMEVALAFEQFDGHLRVSRETVVAGGSADPRSRHVREVARTGSFGRPIIHIPSILEQIGTSVRQHTQQKEQ